MDSIYLKTDLHGSHEPSKQSTLHQQSLHSPVPITHQSFPVILFFLQQRHLHSDDSQESRHNQLLALQSRYLSLSLLSSQLIILAGLNVVPKSRRVISLAIQHYYFVIRGAFRRNAHADVAKRTKFFTYMRDVQLANPAAYSSHIAASISRHSTLYTLYREEVQCCLMRDAYLFIED
eukprot:559261-Pelagomonas_calceolata.AAC.5